MQKKLIYTFSFALYLLGSAMQVQAQYIDMEFGAKAGYARMNIVGDDDPEFRTRSGFALGFTFDFYMTNAFTFRPELVYVTKGSQTRTMIEGITVPVDLTFDVNYIEVPLLVKWTPLWLSKISPTLHAGPYVAYKTESRIRVEEVTSGISFSDPDDSIRSVDYGAAFGAGLDMQVNDSKVSIEGRYTWGRYNLISNPADPKYNGVFTATIGVTL